jgi:hypothetical protein
MENTALRNYIKANVLTSTEACELLQVSRQRLSTITKEGVLTPIKSVAQTMIFLRSDVENYIKYKRPQHILDSFAPLYDYSGTTSKSLTFFEDNISRLSNVVSIFIYFEKMDALLNNFFMPSGDYQGYLLQGLHIPHFIIRDVEGKELWLGGCNCGYNGAGPNGSIEILDYLEKSSAIKLPPNYSDVIFSNKIVNFFVNEDGSTETVTRDCIVDSFDGNGSVNAYYHTKRLVLLHDALPSYKSDVEKTIITKYRAFIPNPTEVIFFPKPNMAREAGYIDLYQNTYNVIIVDATGRELWLNSCNISITPSHKQDNVREILELCGFDFGNNESVSQKISDWLATALHFIRPVSAPSRYIKSIPTSC